MPTWMDFEGITLSEISQTEKDKYCIISLICGIFKKKKTQTHRSVHREQISDCERQGTGVW